MVRVYCEGLPLIEGQFSYLTAVTNSRHRFILLRFRLNRIPCMLGHPSAIFSLQALPPCPCDGVSSQSDIHILFFCKFYLELRKRFNLPTMRKHNFRQCSLGMSFLKMLPDHYVCYCVASLV